MNTIFTRSKSGNFKKSIAATLFFLLVYFSSNIYGQATVNCWASWASSGGSTAATFVPPCASNGGPLLVPSSGYTFWNGPANANYTFTATPGSTGWGTAYISVYYINSTASAWVQLAGGAGTVTFNTPVAGTTSPTYTAPYLVTVISNGSANGCLGAWPGGPTYIGLATTYSASLTYKQNNNLSVTPVSSEVCSNGGSTTLTLSPTGGTTSLNTGVGTVSGASYTAPNNNLAASGTVHYVLGACSANSGTITVDAASSYGGINNAGPVVACNYSTGVVP
ncbi:MAG: hypothetical protein JWO06_3083, partial [Bacteroidota bacterium]|nr:hypothetical protein [Bacteroidota bacterium]